MAEIHHELIRASAGTGKTYQLTNRYLRILFLTQEPEKIIALTFTRKAAGEFFEKIFRRLADAAESPASAKRLGNELGLSLTAEDCLNALRLLLARLHQLQLSTYDSFFSRIVQTFPFELGLAGAPALLDEDQQLRAIERAELL
ncbi:MAG TPA: UvrD-helicase domain-containing protein, partial [Opitutaceae bacterium]